MTLINPYDREALRRQFASAEPFPFIAIDNFLEPSFAAELVASYPTFERATEQGMQFSALNERRKVQITDARVFPPPVARLNQLLASPEFLADVSYITGIPRLLADPSLAGGGMHITGPHGRLDVHVDFNRLDTNGWHRRLNILLYLNPDWKEEWGGAIELWDRDVKKRFHSFTPLHNRCVLFATSEISFHGVTALTCPEDRARRSFAAYYYTAEPPPDWDGRVHTTIFRARPDEWWRGHVLMPLEQVGRRARELAHRAARLFSRPTGNPS